MCTCVSTFMSLCGMSVYVNMYLNDAYVRVFMCLHDVCLNVYLCEYVCVSALCECVGMGVCVGGRELEASLRAAASGEESVF